MQAKSTKKLWGGRFKKELHPSALLYSSSLGVDKELLEADIKTSQAQASMLARCGLISKKEAKKLSQGLNEVKKKLAQEDLAKYDKFYEDIHTLIQVRLEKKVGPLAKKLHTARSRNDQVATATRLYLREKLKLIIKAISSFQKALLSVARANREVILPGYTHLQRAQVILLAHQLLAYVEMLERDKTRLADAQERMEECPLGAAALAGTSLAIDRNYLAKQLGFKRICENSIDAVSDRDFMLETLSAIAILFVHLSRLAEDFILFSSSEFGFVSLSDEYSTGSSLMPQKRNPDILELVRGKSGEACGNLISLLVTMKGLPLAYNRDMQEDKRAVFNSIKLALETLDVLRGLILTIKVDKKACFEAANDSLLYATDFLDYLVAGGLAFKDAYELVGKVVVYSLEKKKSLAELKLNELKRFSKLIDANIYKIFSPQTSLQRKKSLGSPQPRLVNAQIAKWQRRLNGG